VDTAEDFEIAERILRARTPMTTCPEAGGAA
jgi:hypothetical protein